MPDTTLTDALDIFEELPHRVQTSVLSNILMLRGHPCLRFTDYPLPVAEYIQASGLMTVRIYESGGVSFFANELTQQLKQHTRRLLELYGIEF